MIWSHAYAVAVVCGVLFLHLRNLDGMVALSERDGNFAPPEDQE